MHDNFKRDIRFSGCQGALWHLRFDIHVLTCVPILEWLLRLKITSLNLLNMMQPILIMWSAHLLTYSHVHFILCFHVLDLQFYKEKCTITAILLKLRCILQFLMWHMSYLEDWTCISETWIMYMQVITYSIKANSELQMSVVNHWHKLACHSSVICLPINPITWK
jgi:hypothetical protein